MVNRSIAQPLLILQRHLKTGDLLRSCGRAPCGYLLAWRGFLGMLPAFWGTEFPQENDQGTLTGWFYGTLGSDPVKIIGLNQPGGKDGVAAFEGAGACLARQISRRRSINLGPLGVPDLLACPSHAKALCAWRFA